jgi:hypothetical protein
VSNIPVDGNVLREKVKKTAVQLEIGNFTASNGSITRFKDQDGLVYKELAGESAAVDSETTGSVAGKTANFVGGI